MLNFFSVAIDEGVLYLRRGSEGGKLVPFNNNNGRPAGERVVVVTHNSI